jgi:hypothetical protein
VDIYEQWNLRKDTYPQQDEAVVIPDLIMKATGAPEELRQHIERVWDDAIRRAIYSTTHATRMMIIVYEATRDDPE